MSDQNEEARGARMQLAQGDCGAYKFESNGGIVLERVLPAGVVEREAEPGELVMPFVQIQSCSDGREISTCMMFSPETARALLATLWRVVRQDLERRVTLLVNKPGQEHGSTVSELVEFDVHYFDGVSNSVLMEWFVEEGFRPPEGEEADAFFELYRPFMDTESFLTFFSLFPYVEGERNDLLRRCNRRVGSSYTGYAFRVVAPFTPVAMAAVAVAEAA